MTTAVFFALEGTLLTRTASREAVVRTALDATLGAAPDALVTAYFEAFAARADALDPEPHRAGMVAVAEQADADPDPEDLLSALRAADADALTVPEGALDALGTLGTDAHLGVLTNGDRAWTLDRIAAHDLPIQTVVTAAEAGARKPDPAPFELARDRVAADEYVLVGDDYERDVEGARAAGFVPIHYEESGPNFWKTLDALA